MKKCMLCLKKEVRGNGPFFQVPSDEHRRTKWTKVCKMTFPPYSLICGDHFLQTDLIIGSKRTQLMPNAVPFVDEKPPTPSPDPFVDVGSPMPNPIPFVDVRTPMQNVVPFVDVRTPVQNVVPFVGVGRPMQMSHNSRINTGVEKLNDTESAVVHSRENSRINTGFHPYAVPQKFFPVPIYKSEESRQTNSVVSDCATNEEVAALRKEIKSLKAENALLQNQLDDKKEILSKMRTLFTEGQFRKMLLPNMNIQWRWDDISNAICMYAAGPRAYNHLFKKGFPLPHKSTLQRWLRTVALNGGVLKTAIDLVRQDTDFTDDDKVCVLSFGEMEVTHEANDVQVAEREAQATNYVQVAMAQGMKKPWKQPVFFDFNREMSKEILENIVETLNAAGFTVVAVVCDMDSKNRKLWTSLGVTPEKPWFANPSNNEGKVFMFVDSPHLLKLIRNHFLDTGFVWNGEILSSRTISELIKHRSESNGSIVLKLTKEHLSVNETCRQKITLATQIFSNTTANAIRRCKSMGKELYKPLETAEMIQLVNDWFDMLNSKLPTYSYHGKEPYGLKPIQQGDIMTRMNNFMSAPIIPGKTKLQLFQKGVLMTNTALVMLHEYVKEKYHMDFVLTNRLSQDVLQNFFGAIRSTGAHNDRPTPKEFKDRLRKYIFARYTDHLQDIDNVANDATTSPGTSNQQNSGDGFSGGCEISDTLDMPEDVEVEPETVILSESRAADFSDLLLEDSL